MRVADEKQFRKERINASRWNQLKPGLNPNLSRSDIRHRQDQRQKQKKRKKQKNEKKSEKKKKLKNTKKMKKKKNGREPFTSIRNCGGYGISLESERVLGVEERRGRRETKKEKQQQTQTKKTTQKHVTSHHTQIQHICITQLDVFIINLAVTKHEN